MKIVNLSPEDRALEEVRRGELGQQVLNNELFKEYMITARGDLLLAMENTKFKESEERDEIWRKLQTLNKLEQHFTRAMQTGIMGSQELSRLQKFKNLMRR